MKRLLVTFVLLTALASMASAQAKKTEAADWHDTTRDVFVNNELDRNAQVLTADNPTRLALTGTTVGAPLFDVVALLGKETALRRLRRFVEEAKAQTPA